ncbi:MAG: MBL fold metallo-hydrolase [Thermomicrobia bacterium]|nr:MBL fold metallo-hydrolase [Thermomicrobia bacterium]
MDITLLGTGSPMAPERCATGMVVTAPGCEPLLIDTCGGFELPRQLAKIGQPINALRNVIVTHRHMDHAGGMPALFIASIPLAIYALPDAHAGIRELMNGCFPEWPIHDGVERIPIEPGQPYVIGGFSVEFFATEHRVPTVAVRVQYRGRTLAFSADGIPNDGMIACARDADLFICDALCAARDGAEHATRARSLMHPVAREAAEMAVAANARSLALTHLARYANADNLLAEARALFPSPVVVLDDGMRLSV